jgi:hypothetical protein
MVGLRRVNGMNRYLETVFVWHFIGVNERRVDAIEHRPIYSGLFPFSIAARTMGIRHRPLRIGGLAKDRQTLQF